jgi:hypothetical protein
MKRRLRFRRLSPSAVAAVLVLLIVGGLVLLTVPISGGRSRGGGREDVVLSTREIQAEQLGTQRRDIERRFGKGSDALDYQYTGIAVEPMDASCIYYRAAQDSFDDVAQFCFRKDKLVSRRAFFVPSR